MNVFTFKDVAGSKRDSLAHDCHNDDDDDDDTELRVVKERVTGEEDNETIEKFNDAGEVLEPFNLKNERQIGAFDESGNYVFKKEHQEIDAWVADLDEAAMEQQIGEASKALAKKRERQAEAEKAEEEAKVNLSLADTKLEILKLMVPGETVARAMKRLSTKPGKKTIITKDIAKANEESKKSINRLIDCADFCISEYGLFGIYDMSYEALEASLVKWEYTTNNSEGSTGTTTIHGPFTSEQIAEWKSAGYFSGSTAVWMRKVNPLFNVSDKKKKISFDMFSDDEDDEEKNTKDDDMVACESNNNNNNSGIDNSEWILSDDIDFGEYVSANNATRSNQRDHRRDINKMPSKKKSMEGGNATVDNLLGDSDDDEVPQGKREGDEEEDDDDDDEEEEEENS